MMTSQKILVAHSISVGTACTEFQGDDPNLCGPERTIENYNSAINRLKTEDLPDLEGIKLKSVFNSLKYFHFCQPGLPPCLGHYTFEGVLAYDPALYLMYFFLLYKVTSYKKGEFPVTGGIDYVEFSEIVLILTRNDTVNFLLSVYTAEFLPQYHLYLVRKDNEKMQCLNINDMIDFYPLPFYMKDGYKMVQPKHSMLSH